MKGVPGVGDGGMFSHCVLVRTTSLWPSEDWRPVLSHCASSITFKEHRGPTHTLPPNCQSPGASSTWPCTDFLAYWVVVAALGNLSLWIVICLTPKDFLITQGPILKPFINHPLLHVHLLAAQVFFSGNPPYKGGAFLRASQASIASSPCLGCLSRCLSKQHLSAPHSDPNLRSQSYK